MNKNTSGVETHRLVCVFVLILFSLTLVACSKGSPQQVAYAAVAANATELHIATDAP